MMMKRWQRSGPRWPQLNSPQLFLVWFGVGTEVRSGILSIFHEKVITAMIGKELNTLLFCSTSGVGIGIALASQFDRQSDRTLSLSPANVSISILRGWKGNLRNQIITQDKKQTLFFKSVFALGSECLLMYITLKMHICEFSFPIYSYGDSKVTRGKLHPAQMNDEHSQFPLPLQLQLWDRYWHEEIAHFQQTNNNRKK